MLSIIVCIKNVLDPEAPASAFEIDGEAKRVKVRGVPPVLNPFDENALEAALRIKDIQESKITVISMGGSLSKPVLRKSLAAGADELLLLEDNIFEDLDSYATASILAAAIMKMGACDIIFTGRQAADTDAGVVGSGIAEVMGIPSVTCARKVEINDGKIRVERVVADGYEVIEAVLPALVTITNELGELRPISVKELMAAQKKPITTLTAQELGVATALDRQKKLLKLYIPQREVNCEIVGGETAEEIGANLALKLRETQII